MKISLKRTSLRTISTVLAIILALPVSWGLAGFYAWLSPFMMLNSVLTLKSFVALNAVAFLVLFFILFRKRWFCHHLCPVGWSCDRISDLNPHRKSSYNSVPDIGKWLALISIFAALAGFPLFLFLDPMAIFNGFFTIFTRGQGIIAIVSFSGFILLLLIHVFFPGIWCARLCPLGGTQLAAADLKIWFNRLLKRKNPESELPDKGRRYFLASGIGLIAGIALPKMLKPSGGSRIRPPASVDPVLFNSLCCRCESCIKACPTHILIPYTGSSDLLSWLTPEVSFNSGYCLESCNLCSRVCPTGAINLFSVEAKNQLVMGIAEIQMDKCLLKNNQECIRCREACKFNAVDFPDAGDLLNVVPLINKEKCVGCGACQVVCPAECIHVRAV